MHSPIFSFTSPPTPQLYPLSLHDALPILAYLEGESLRSRLVREKQLPIEQALQITDAIADALHSVHQQAVRSEEHTSELQSPMYLVCRLLLEKKKKTENNSHNMTCTRSFI